MSKTPHFEEGAVCDICGRYGAYEFGNKRLCVDCYETRASCCPEFGGDDLWEIQDGPPKVETQKRSPQQRAKRMQEE